MTINFIAVGKIKESWYRDACAEYLKRMGAFAQTRVYEPSPADIPQSPTDAQIQRALSQEAVRIGESIRHGSYTVAMCIEGEQLSSEKLAAMLARLANGGTSTVNFVVGSSHGLAGELKRSADFRMSMSPMTFPHSLARVMLYEQVYRALSINNNSKYHK